MMIEYTLPRSHAPLGSRLACVVAELIINMTRHSRPRAATSLEMLRYQTAAANRPNDCRSGQNGGVASDNRQGSAGEMHFPAVHSSDHDIAGGIRGDQAQKKADPSTVADAHDEQRSEKEQNALQVERRIHQVSPRGVDHPAVNQLAGANPEIADGVARVAVGGLKTCGGDRLENQVPDSCYDQEGGSTCGSQAGLTFPTNRAQGPAVTSIFTTMLSRTAGSQRICSSRLLSTFCYATVRRPRRSLNAFDSSARLSVVARHPARPQAVSGKPSPSPWGPVGHEFGHRTRRNP